MTTHTPPLHALETRPAELFAPGEYLKEELEARGWTVDDLVRRVHPCPTPRARRRGGAPRLTAAAVQSVLDGGPLDAMTAHRIGRAFGTSPEFWLNLEAIYRYWLEKQ